MTAPLTNKNKANAAGVSVLELLIVVAMIGVVCGFAVMQIVRARRLMTRDNAAQKLVAYLEKARADSVRRHPAAANEMAQVTIVDATSYSVTIDSTGDGTLDAPQTIRLPTGSNLQFQGSFPRTIYFNWRGRTVDAGGNLAIPAYIGIACTGYPSARVDLTTSGEPSLDGPPPSTTVVNSAAPAPVFRNDTQFP